MKSHGEAIHELTKFIQKQEQLNGLIIQKQKQDFDFVKSLAKLTLITPFFPINWYNRWHHFLYYLFIRL